MAARKSKPTDMQRGRGKRPPKLSASEKADQITQLIRQAKTNRAGSDSMTSNKPRKKRKRQPSAMDAFDRFGSHLPDKDREIVRELMEDAEEEDHVSLFEKAFGKLYGEASSPNADFRSDDATRNMNRASLALVLSLIPVAEVEYRRSQKQSNAYALNAFIDQARELTEDLRTMTDADNQAGFIAERVIRPLFLNLGQNLLTEVSNLKSTVDTEVSHRGEGKMVKQAIDAAALSMGKFFAEMQIGINKQVLSYLQGDTNNFNVPAALSNNRRRRKRPK